MRRLLVLLPLAAWLACGDDYGSESAAPPPAAGERTGPCYPNGTCNGGLTCIDTVCVVVDAGAAPPDASGPSPIGDAGTDAPSGLQLAACPATASNVDDGRVQCGGANLTCVRESYCCQGADVDEGWRCMADDKGCAGARIDCDSNDDCGEGTKCCLVLAAHGGTACPRISLRGGRCEKECPQDHFACARDEDCDRKRCASFEARLADDPRQVSLRACE